MFGIGFGVWLGYACPALSICRVAFDAVPVLAAGLCHAADLVPALEWLVELLLS